MLRRDGRGVVARRGCAGVSCDCWVEVEVDLGAELDVDMGWVGLVGGRGCMVRCGELGGVVGRVFVNGSSFWHWVSEALLV